MKHRLISQVDIHMREILKGGSVAFGMRAAGSILGFIFNLVLARYLGAHDTGIYFLVLTVMMLCTVIARMGMDNVLLRLTAAHAEQNQWAIIQGVYKKGIGLASLVSIALTIIVWLSASAVSHWIFQASNLQLPLGVMALSILPMTLIALHISLLKGLKKIPHAMVLEGFGVPLIGIPLLMFFANVYSVLGAVIAHVVAASLIALLGVYLWHRATPHRAPRHREAIGIRQLLAASLPLIWMASISFLMYRIDIFMLGIWADAQSVGIYGMAFKLSQLLNLVFIAINSIAAPKFAALYTQHDLVMLRRLASNISTLLFVLPLPILAIFIFLPSWVLSVFGTDFVAGANTLAILAVGQFVNVALGYAGSMLMMSGREKLAQTITYIALISKLAMNFLLIPSLGMTGAAISTLICFTAMHVCACIMVFQSLRILPLPIGHALG